MYGIVTCSHSTDNDPNADKNTPSIHPWICHISWVKGAILKKNVRKKQGFKVLGLCAWNCTTLEGKNKKFTIEHGHVAYVEVAVCAESCNK
jgi:hypothetical protein